MASVSETLRKTYMTKNFKVRIIIDNKEDLMKIQPWTSVKELKSKISKKIYKQPNLIRLFYCNTEMMDNRTMLEYQVIDDDEPTIILKLVDPTNKKHYIQVYGSFPNPPVLMEIIEEIKYGFLQGYVPNLILEGTGGTYNLRGTNKKVIGLFKPIDEEAFAPNNQKGYVGKFGQQSFRNGILSGEGSIREVVAYILDKNSFLNVPETTFVEMVHPSFNKKSKEMLLFDKNNIKKLRNSITHNFIIENLINLKGNLSENYSTLEKESSNSEEEKISDIFTKKYGSLQKFIEKSDVAANFCSDIFDTEQVHKIGILDLRILNCDRNDENILVLKKKNKITNKSYLKLIPIDHSLSLPDIIEISEYEMCWMTWQQSKKPFSKEILQYIEKIDIQEDIKRISENIKIREVCLKNFRISNTLLKIGAKNGLSLYEIGRIIYRPEYEDTPSKLELIIEKTNKMQALIANLNKLKLVKEIEIKSNFKSLFKPKKNSVCEKDIKTMFEINQKKLDENSELGNNKQSSPLKKNEDNNDLTIIEEEKNTENNLFKLSQNKLLQFDINNNLANELFEKEEDTNKTKRPLLKRTLSEPELIRNESIEVVENLNLEAKNKLKNKLGKKDKENSEDFDSPFNEIFFYYFEQNLVEFLEQEYKIKIK